MGENPMGSGNKRLRRKRQGCALKPIGRRGTAPARDPIELRDAPRLFVVERYRFRELGPDPSN